MTGLLVRLSRHWGVSPVDLRDLTLAELSEMGAVLVAEDKERRRH